MKRGAAPPPLPLRGISFKIVRIAILLGILIVVAATTLQDRYRSTRWREALFVSIYPIAADDSSATQRYIATLDATNFSAIDEFFAREGARYHLAEDTPVKTRLRPALTALPPQRPASAGVLGTMWWSLRLRWWAWRVSGHTREPEDIRLFVLYGDPERSSQVPHSLGLRKGLIGVVYAFATPQMTSDNTVVMAHELLHTLGATDKYDPTNDTPRFPEGYADPEQTPLLPQTRAEIMAGRLMLAPTRWRQAESLREVVMGPSTAAEIRWPALSAP